MSTPSPVTEPAARDFLCVLHLKTQVDPFVFTIWLRNHAMELRAKFEAAGEYEDEFAFAVWARLLYTGAFES